MADDKRASSENRAGPTANAAAARRRRQAEALRANLRRRKAATGDGEDAPKKADKPRGEGA